MFLNVSVHLQKVMLLFFAKCQSQTLKNLCNFNEISALFLPGTKQKHKNLNMLCVRS